MSEALLSLHIEQLREVCSFAKILVSPDKKKHMLIRLISESVDNVIESEEEEVAEQHLNNLLEQIKTEGSRFRSQLKKQKRGM